MIQLLKEPFKRCTAVILAVLLALTLWHPALAEESESRVLRVAFPQMKGLTETAEDGSHYGLVVDYLNEIAKYTGWEYEYVDTDSESMINKFLAGEFDLMGGTYYRPSFEELFAYPDFNTGYSKSCLLARRDDYSVTTNDLESFNGKTIGVYERAEENIRRLKEFLSINNLDCTLKYYKYEDMFDTGNLYPFLKKGEVDLLLGNSLEQDPELRIVVTYDSQPYYIVTNIGDQETLDGLNMALEKISDSNPNFGVERYAANFTDNVSSSILLNGEELEYIQQKQTVTVAVSDDWSPLFSLNKETKLPYGLVPDILQEVTEYTGLHFSYVYADSYIDALHMVQTGRADILGFFLGSEDDAIDRGLALSSSYVSMNSIVVRNKASSYPDEGLIGAVVEGRKMPSGVTAAEVRAYPSITEALAAVNRGEADFIYGLSARLELDIQRHHFSNLVPVTLVNERSELSFAMVRPVDRLLFPILNKAINSLPVKDKEEILNRNIISIGTTRLSVMELIYSNPVMFVTVLTFILLLLLATVLLITRARMRAAVIQSNLEKAEAESRAKGEFLSRMSHEIRTPMNAVVGLANLTAMMDDVPERVRENLSKIRSSSHYLLSLINDILDMSRIDSGMLSVASESFSLERMLGELQSMMGSEAQRRGLTFTLEKKMSHSDLVGDAIRLQQVLTNLLSNAFKFTPAGGTVLLQIHETDYSGTDASFSFQVVDDGVGIPPEDQQRIFSSFEQLGPNSSKSQGTGLGLTISRSIVQLMGGELALKSEPGKGSTFYFSITLPLGQEEERENGTQADDLLDGIHILLAEDNDLNAEIAVQLLEIQGATVHRSSNGRLVVEQFAQSKPGEYQVILMDIQMPEMNGLEAARAIRSLSHPDAVVIPIVAMTANSFKEDADAAADAGMNGFVSKPLDVNYLYGLLRRIVKGNSAH